MYSKEQLLHLKKLIKFKKLQDDSFNPQWNQVQYFQKFFENFTNRLKFSISFPANEKTSKLGKQEVSDMVVEASSTFSRNGSVRTSKRSVRSHSRQSSLAGDVSDGHISTSG